MRLAKKSLLFFVADVGTSVVGFFATWYFARTVGSGPLGQYFQVIALVAWITIPTNGLASAVNKRVSEGQRDNAVFSGGVALSVVYGAIVGLLVVIGGQYVNAYAEAEVSWFLAALLVGNVLFGVTKSGVLGQKKIGTAGFFRLGERILRTGGQIALIFLGYELSGLLAGHIFALAIATLVGIVLFGFRPEIPDRDSVESLLDYGRYSWLGSMKGKTMGWMDTIVLGIFVASGLVAVYQVSWQLASILVLVSNAVENTLFPEISDIAADGEHEAVKDLLSEALFYAGIFVIPGFFGALVLGGKILRIYGPDFVVGAPILLVLIIARTINVYEMQLLNVINAIDRPDVAYRINAVFILVNVTLNLALVARFGWFGAAVATTLSALLVLALTARAVVSLIGRFELPVRGVVQQIVASLVMAVLIRILQESLPIQNMWVTVSLVGFGAALYGLTLYGLSSRLRVKVQSLAVS